MPRAKKIKRNDNQDVLTTRLMQMSLKMDDHIYCNKLISVTAAEEYLLEIAGLKSKCPRTNVRALQVIEKLTRYMNGVIAGDQIPAGYVPISSVEAYREFPEPCSPVYSLPEEDKTELLTEDRFINDQIVDLTEDDMDDTAIQHDNLIEKVKNAISNMGLRETQAEIEDVDGSQSILDNFHNDDVDSNGINRQPDYYVIHVVNNQSNELLNEIVETENVENDQNCSQSVLDISYNRDKEVEIYQNITESNVGTQPTLKEISNTITMSITDTLATPRPNFTVEAPNMLKEIEASVVDLQNETTLKSSTETTASESKKGNKRGRSKKNKDDITKNPKSKPRIKNKSKTANKQNYSHRGRNAFNIVHGKGVLRSDISVDNPETAIYNTNVECDLSWVENLRYVREINPEENDTTLCIMDGNFWNNFSLPDNWNDEDFKV